MGAMGEYEYPDITISQAVEIIKTIDEKNIQRQDVLANAIGHKGPTAYKGGGFRSKITALARYGLLVGKPTDLRLSDTAKLIIHPRSEDDLNNAIRRAVLGVPILAAIHEKLQGKLPSDFWIPLYDCTGIDQKIVKEHAENIRRLYADAVQYLKIGPETISDRQQTPAEAQDMECTPNLPNSEMMMFKGGGISMTLKINAKNIEVLKTILDNLKEEPKEGN